MKTSWCVLAPCVIGVVIAAAVLNCIAPFTAVAVVAGIALARRYAIGITLAAWLVNQFYGYAFSQYPHTIDTYLAGLSIAVGAIAATLIASAIGKGRFGVSSLTAFVAGFALYEGITYLASLRLGGSTAYTPPYIAEVFVVNAIFFIPLFAVAFWTAHKQPQANSFVHEHLDPAR